MLLAMTTVHDAMKATATPILEIGRAWIVAPTTAAVGNELGLDGFFGFWINGRAGVLGDAPAAVATAAIGFVSPVRVAELWDGRPAPLSGLECSRRYRDTAADWGRAMFTDLAPADLTHLADLAERMAGTADASTGALFAGWRALESPTDPAGRATVALQVLREMRGGAHLSAVQAAGLTPLAAIVSTDDPVRGGAAGAERFGWVDRELPTPDPETRAAAEVITDRICAPAYSALSENDRARFVDLVAAVRAAVDI